MEISTSGLEHWPEFFHAGHRFNMSPELPSSLYSIFSIIHIIQIIPVIWSTNILEESNQIISSLKVLSNAIVFLDFFNTNILLTVIFVLGLLFFLYSVFTLFLSKTRIIKPVYSISTRVILELLVPFFMFYAFTTLQKIVENYIFKETSSTYIIIGTISVVLYLVLFAAVQTVTANPLNPKNNTFMVWNKWCYLTTYILPMLFQQLQSLNAWDLIKSRYVCHSANIVLSIIIIICQSKLPFIHQVPGFIYITSGISGILFNMAHIFCTAFHNEMLNLIFFTDLILGFVSLFFGNAVYDYISVNKIPDYSKINYVEDDEQELEEISVERPEFPPNIVNELKTLDIIHVYMLRSSQKAILLATFVLERTTRPYMQVECLRVLSMLNALTPSLLDSALEIPINSLIFPVRQLLCDLQYEAIGMETKDENIDPAIDSLAELTGKIRAILLEFVDAVSMDQPENMSTLVRQYTAACKEFEDVSSLYLVRSPNSQKLTRAVGKYYQQLRGDYECSQAWFSRTSLLKTSASGTMSSSLAGLPFSVHGSRRFSKSSSHFMESSFSQRFNAQHALQKIYSRAVVGSIVALCIHVVLIIFSTSFSYKSSVEFIIDENTFNANPVISQILMHPVYSLWKCSGTILSDCDAIYKDMMDELSPQLVNVFGIGNTSMIYTLEDATRIIAKIEESVNTFSNKISIWPQDILSEEFPVTLQYLLTQFVMHDDSKPKMNCTEEAREHTKLVYDIIETVYIPIHKMQQKLHQFMLDCSEPFLTNYMLISLAYAVVNIIVILLCVLYSIRQQQREESWFWSAFLEIDTKALEAFRQQLLNNELTVKDSHLQSSTNDTDNILGSDEIESGSHDSFNAPENARNLLQGFEEDHKVAEESKCRISNDILFTICLTVYFVLFSFLVFGSRVPSNNLLYAQIDLTAITSKLTNTAASIFEVSATCLYYTVNKIMNVDVIESVNKTIKYVDLRINETKRITIHSTIGLDTYNTFFKELEEIASKIKIAFNNYISTNDIKYLKEIGLLGIKDTLAVVEDIDYWFYQNHKVIKWERESAQITSDSLIGLVGFIFFFILLFRIYEYYKHFQSLKAIVLLPASYSATVSSLLAQFDPSTYVQSSDNDVLKFQSRYIIKQSVNAIVVIDYNMKILDVNKATVEMLRFKKESLIRKDISTLIIIINPSDKSQFEQQYYDFFSRLQFLGSQPAAAPANEPRYNLLVRRVDNTVVPVSCLLIPISNNNEEGPAFAILLRDRTALLEQEKAFKDAQNRVESLLLRILPRVMATKLMSNNPNLFSKVEQATIIFIAIADFLDWCGDRSHVEIMQMLDVIFSKFDKKIAKFPTLVKIKIINGVYMAAGGLFNEISDNSHQLEAVKFCMQCGQWVKKRNILTKSETHLQIGVNTGGPIIAGILGIDKPLFDIWGDAVNVSARLETSAIPDTIQMLQETVSALPIGAFDIYEREGVFLKGKGITSTYCINIPEPVIKESNI